MKDLTKKVVVLTLLFMSSNGFSQVTGAGIQVKYNFARHLNVIQNIPKRFARTAEDVLATPGIDIYGDYSFGNNWFFRGKAGIETKGFVGQITHPSYENESYRFRYRSADLSIGRRYGQGTAIQAYNYLGLSVGNNYKREVEVLGFWAQPIVDPDLPLNFNDYARWTLGMTAGFGLSFDDVLWLELEYNRDIIAPLQTPDLHIYNLVYSVQVGVNLLKIITS